MSLTNDIIPTHPRHMNVEQVADYLGLSRWTIFRMCKTGIIPFTAYGKVKRFDRILIDEWVARRTVPGKD